MSLELMTQDEAVTLLGQALQRVKNKQKNSKGSEWQCGGAYWRLCKVLEFYVYPNLVHMEGIERAEFLIKTHGKVRHNLIESNSSFVSALEDPVMLQSGEFSLYYAATEWLELQIKDLTGTVMDEIDAALIKLGCTRQERRPYERTHSYVPPVK